MLAGISFIAPHVVTNTSYGLARRFTSLVVVCSTSFFGFTANEHTRGLPQCSLKALSRKQLQNPFCALLPREKVLNQLAGCFSGCFEKSGNSLFECKFVYDPFFCVVVEFHFAGT